ncbi:Crp/Fnr family transcriptional regulator [Vibrio sp. SM6]|uniref:Crp/Fnr family transcriptional regulator n=1 Tax=Vibrio agarilyticus TaxID=2726741 RepID=A0A7X8TTR3_9VIBR|nr:Crp/Fnr family transcriptional regulator [Vibrio agarilyticus]NLS14643.1 Crp/Fnr family transcriptional regulator [Vibrio agarilyticus]
MPQTLSLTLYQRLLALPCCRPIKLSAGQAFIVQGESSDTLFLVTKADFSVSYLSPAGKRYTVSSQKAFSGILGEMEIFRQGGQSVFSVVASSPANAFQISRVKLIEAVMAEPSLAVAFLQLISHRYEESIGHTLDNILHSLRFNAVRLLVKQSELASSSWFDFNIEQHAAELGATPRALRRVIKELLDEKGLEKQKGRYQIVDLKRFLAELDIINQR